MEATKRTSNFMLDKLDAWESFLTKIEYEIWELETDLRMATDICLSSQFAIKLRLEELEKTRQEILAKLAHHSK